MRIREAALILVLAGTGLLTSCSGRTRPEAVPPPAEASLGGPGEFKVLPDGHLVVEKPVRWP